MMMVMIIYIFIYYYCSTKYTAYMKQIIYIHTRSIQRIKKNHHIIIMIITNNISVMMIIIFCCANVNLRFKHAILGTVNYLITSL